MQDNTRNTKLSTILKKLEDAKNNYNKLKKEEESKSDMHSLCVHDIDEEHGWDDGW